MSTLPILPFGLGNVFVYVCRLSITCMHNIEYTISEVDQLHCDDCKISKCVFQWPSVAIGEIIAILFIQINFVKTLNISGFYFCMLLIGTLIFVKSIFQILLW